MNCQECKEKVLKIESEAKQLLDVVEDEHYINLLKDLISCLELVVRIFNEEKNMEVLENSIAKGENEEKYPLDRLCEKVVQKIKDIEGLLKKEIFDFMKLGNSVVNQYGHRQYDGNAGYYFELINMLKDTELINLLSTYEVLKHLEGHNKTLIILGPNGSGKTSFANYLKNVEANIKVIPASKPIKALGHIPSIYNSTLSAYNDEIYNGGNLSQDLLQKLIVGICTEHDNVARKYYDTREEGSETTYEKIKKIFDDFFEVKLDNSAFSNKEMKAKKGAEEPFYFNQMSDGERVAFFYIATVMVAPKQSFIIVDEPENHLNPAIYNKIWDRLIADRNDCQFVFISHTMEFINARSNYELVKIKKFIYPNKFEFDFLGDILDEIKTELIVEIVGSRKPILFCEGSKTDFDYKVYENLFGEKYTVIPTGNCLSVVNSVESCNMHATLYSIQSAIGIIDSDLKSEQEMEKLRGKNVYSLRCNEIEMLLLDEAIFKKVLKQIYKPESEFETYKKTFFSKIRERKDHIIKRLVKTQIDEKLKSSIIDDKNNKDKDAIKTNLDSIFNSLDVDALWNECETKLKDIISSEDYDKALKYCCLEHTEIIVGVVKRYVPGYATIALGILRDDKELAEDIRSRYFSEVKY